MTKEKWEELIPHIQAIALAMTQDAGVSCDWTFQRGDICVKVAVEVYEKLKDKREEFGWIEW